MYVDLHLHSLKSDGAYSPEDIVKLAYLKGINIIALTDHDTSSGLSKAEQTAKELGISFYGGIEFTAYITEDLYEHILGYGFSDLREINQYLDKLRFERISLVKKYVNLLNNNGFNVTFEDIANQTPGEHLTVRHVAKWLSKNYFYGDKKRGYSLITSQGKYHIPENCHYYTEVIPLIRRAHGIAVLAHPFRYHPEFRENIVALENHIVSLMNYGLNGIEGYYVTHSAQDIEICTEIAQKYNLIITGGSDFHGWEDKVPMGGITIPKHYFNQFINAISQS